LPDKEIEFLILDKVELKRNPTDSTPLAMNEKTELDS
jgi:hypothetical protein